MHYRALDIGRVFLMGTWIQILIFPVVGKLVTKVDPRLLLIVANAGIFTSLFMNAHLTADASMGSIVKPLFIRAVGTGFGFVPLTFLAVASLPVRQRAGGTALFNLTRELGASIGTAWMSTLLDRESKRAFTSITSHVDIGSSVLAEQSSALVHGPGARLADPSSAALAILRHRIEEQALLRAFNGNFLLLATAFLCASGLIVLMRRPKPAVAIDTNAH
jgi:DHA2 family multidrug resistance protein